MSNYIVPIVHWMGWGSSALGVWSGANTLWQLTRWNRGHGKVTGYETRPNGEDGTLYFPKQTPRDAVLRGFPPHDAFFTP